MGECSLGLVTTAEANHAYRENLRWVNMLRYHKKGRDLPGGAYPVYPVIFIEEWCAVTKDEILQELKRLGAKVAYSTLDRYVSDGLVTEPKTKSLGRKLGKVSEYKTRALFEAFAAWSLLQGGVRISKPDIRKAREKKDAFLSRMDANAGQYNQLWIDRIIQAYLSWKYPELPTPTNRTDEQQPVITFWGDAISIDGAIDELPERMKGALGDQQDGDVCVRVTQGFVRVYKKHNDQWELIGKDDIGGILNLE